MEIAIQEKIKVLLARQKELLETSWELDKISESQDQKLKNLFEKETAHLSETDRQRIQNELYFLGPLEPLLQDETITEILVNGPQEIFFERSGKLESSTDSFYNEITYNQAIEKLSQMCRGFMNQEKPFIESQYGKLRITLIYAELARGNHLVSIRKQPETRWSLDQLAAKNWCSAAQLEILRNIVRHRENFIVIGGTSSGKTSVLQALLGELTPLERAVIIEDTQELNLTTAPSVSLLTRSSSLEKLCNVDMSDLLKRALRLRPDRLVIGEIRGAEATNLLMALATGHDGSFGSLHARTAHEALLRLEMLIQMGAPQWSLDSVRRLMGMTIQYILVVEKKNGLRQLTGIHKITSVESSGLTLMRVDD